MERRERLTFGFKNTQILCGLLVFCVFTYLQILFCIAVPPIFSIILNLFISTGLCLSYEGYISNLKNYKDLHTIFVWGMLLSFPLSILVIFRVVNFNKIVKWINKI